MSEAPTTMTPPSNAATTESFVPIKKLSLWATVREFFFRRSYLIFALFLFVVAVGLTYYLIDYWLKELAPEWGALDRKIRDDSLETITSLGFLGYLVPVICFGIWLGIVLFHDRFKKFPLTNFMSLKDITKHITKVYWAGAIILLVWASFCGTLGGLWVVGAKSAALGHSASVAAIWLLVGNTTIGLILGLALVPVGAIFVQKLDPIKAWVAGIVTSFLAIGILFYLVGVLKVLTAGDGQIGRMFFIALLLTPGIVFTKNITSKARALGIR